MLRRLLAIATITLLGAGPLDLTPPSVGTAGMRAAAITGDRLSGFVLPILPVKSDLVMKATRAFKWKVDDTQRLALQGDVRITAGGYSFMSRNAIVWINRIPSAEGLITQAAIWFADVSEPTRAAGLGVEGRNVLVTCSLRGDVKLTVPVMEDQPPSAVTLAPADARLAAYLQGIAAAPATLAGQPRVDAPKPPPEKPLVVGGDAMPEVAATNGTSQNGVSVPAQGTPAFKSGDVITFTGRETTIDEKQDVITVIGGAQVDVMSRDPRLKTGEIRLSAERAVIFLKPGSLTKVREGSGQLDAGVVDGVYLEGDVNATDGSYAMRGAQVYFDVATGRAAALQAVLRTYVRGGVPVISRAAEVRQVAKDQFEARDARVSVSEFYTPHLSVGADRITVTKGPGSDPSTVVEAQDVTFRAGSAPIFYWPTLRGDAGDVILPQVLLGYNSYTGTQIGTRWDLWKLAGWQPPFDMKAELQQDVYTSNGYGLGTRFSGVPGDLNLYGFYDLQRTEQSSSGIEYTSSLKWRGMIDGGTTVPLDSGSLMQAQMAWVSDGAWVSTFKQRDFANHREYETSAFIKLSSGNSAFDMLGKYDLDQYVSNSWMLASRPYSVSKFPEASYRRYGDALFGDSVNWTQEYNANIMAMQLEKGTAQDMAANPLAFAGNFNANTNIQNAYNAQGYNQNNYVRTFTRHELVAPLDWQGLRVAPFVQGTAIGYFLNDFQNYANQNVGAGADGGAFRGIVGAGTRMSTEFSQNFDGVQNATLDVNRLRWVVQPNSTLWAGYDTTTNGEYPVFDQDVEGVSAARAAQLGVTQRWQTYRGGPGDWRSVDWIMLDVGAVVNNSGANYQRSGVDGATTGLNSLAYYQSPTPQFFSYRPELSQWGNHGYARATWAMSSSLTAYGSTTLLFEDRNTQANAGMGNFARGSVGMSMQHTPDVSTFCEYRMINNFYNSSLYPNDELLQPGVAYQIGKLYTLSAGPQIDLGQGDLRALSATLNRTFPDFNLGAAIGYSSITNEYTFGMQLSIPAAGGKGLNTGALNSDGAANPWTGQNGSF